MIIAPEPCFWIRKHATGKGSDTGENKGIDRNKQFDVGMTPDFAGNRYTLTTKLP